jgi:purine-binding chemotaxis protein CheW
MRGFVLAACGDSTFALPVADVRAILPRPHLVRPPACPAALAGFADLGTHLLPVLRLHRLLGLDATADPGEDLYSHIVELRADLGLLVGRVLDVMSDATIAGTTAPDTSYNRCVTSMLEIAGQSVPLIEPARLLDTYERERLAAFRALADERHENWSVPA